VRWSSRPHVNGGAILVFFSIHHPRRVLKGCVSHWNVKRGVARLQLLCNQRRNIGLLGGVSPVTFSDVVTADRVLKHGGHANQICLLCITQRESALHMLAQCSYSNSVWSRLAQWIRTQLQALPTNNYRRFKTWWTDTMGEGQNQQDVNTPKHVIYMAWNIWKERCRRVLCKHVFDNKAMTLAQLMNII
jgi:hypothetical protein